MKTMIFLILVFLTSVSATAQDTSTCDKELFASTLEEYAEMLRTATNVTVVMEQVAQYADNAVTICNEEAPATSEDAGLAMSYTSSEYGLQAVIGPVTLPTGIYRVTAKTDGFMIAAVETLEGTCETSILGLFSLSQGQASNGASTILSSENCEALFTISNTQSAWTLDFLQINSSQAENVIESYSSDEYGLQAAIGPITFLDGRYRVKVTTEGFMIGDIRPLDGTCETDLFGLFSLSQGQASSGATSLFRSDNCTGIIILENVTEPWTLVFEQIQ
jgi:hypothetical protein